MPSQPPCRIWLISKNFKGLLMNNLVSVTSQPNAELSEGQQYLSFQLQREAFAIGILHIKEILEYGQVTAVPMMPSFLRGVINLRGSVVPVIDLNARFGREPSTIGKRTCIVIVEVASGDQTQILGMVVDAVNAVLDIPATDLEPAPAFGTGIRTDFIAAMGKLEQGFLIILNLNRILSWQDVEALRQLDIAPASSLAS